MLPAERKLEIEKELEPIEARLQSNKRDFEEKNPDVTSFTSSGDLGFLEIEDRKRYTELNDELGRIERVLARERVTLKKSAVGAFIVVLCLQIFVARAEQAKAEAVARVKEQTVHTIDTLPLREVHVNRIIDETNLHTVTAYTSREEETDDSPCISADGHDICKRWEEGQVLCASNDHKIGTMLRLGGKVGVTCKVVDRMNKRYTGKRHVDLYFGHGVEALRLARQFGSKKNIPVSIVK